MRPKLLALFALIVLAAALPAAASAKVKVGISENNQQMFADPNFKALNVKYTRLVMAYNVIEAAGKGDNELSDRVAPYIAAATAQGVEVLVTLEHARGAAEVCKTSRTKPQCKLPSPAQYEAAFKAFRALFPQVKTFIAWNEGNHFTQPISRYPKVGAQFAKIAERNCAGCTILPVDVLDQSDSAKAKKPTFKSTTKWVKAWRKAYGKTPKICGIHPYSDTNRTRTTGTKAIIKALRCKKYWMTEAGGIVKFGTSFPFNLKRAATATKYMFTKIAKIKGVERLYAYTFFGGLTDRFDSGIVEIRSDGSTQTRPAYDVVKKYAGQ
jgi:hypothetical protein